MAVLQCADMPVFGLAPLVSGVQWPEDVRILAFRSADWKFEPISAVDPSWLDGTLEGRIFSPAGELRWRKVANMFRVVYLGKEPTVSGLDEYSHELANLKPAVKEVLLWGVRSDLEQEWLEQQVPQYFSYPLKGGVISRGRVALSIEQWSSTLGGTPCFGRYHSIREVSGGNNAA